MASLISGTRVKTEDIVSEDSLIGTPDNEAQFGNNWHEAIV